MLALLHIVGFDTILDTEKANKVEIETLSNERN